MKNKQIILASSSPRRREILENIGLHFSILPSEYEEDNTLDLPPVELVKQLALSKAQWVPLSRLAVRLREFDINLL